MKTFDNILKTYISIINENENENENDIGNIKIRKVKSEFEITNNVTKKDVKDNADKKDADPDNFDSPDTGDQKSDSDSDDFDSADSGEQTSNFDDFDSPDTTNAEDKNENENKYKIKINNSATLNDLKIFLNEYFKEVYKTPLY